MTRVRGDALSATLILLLSDLILAVVAADDSHSWRCTVRDSDPFVTRNGLAAPLRARWASLSAACEFLVMSTPAIMLISLLLCPGSYLPQRKRLPCVAC